MRFDNRFFAILGTLLLVGGFVYFFSNIVAYVAIAWVLALILDPMKRLFQRRLRYRRFQASSGFCAVLAMALGLGVLTLLFVLFIPLIVQQANNLAGVDYQSIAQALQEPMSQLTLWLESRGLIDQQISAEDQLQYSLRLQDWFKPAKIGDFFTFLLTAAGNIIIGLFSVLFITFFFLQDESMFSDFLVAVMPNNYENNIRQAFLEIERLLTRYFGGLLIQISILTTFMWILLSLLQIENALLIAFFAALINLIPYVGPFIGAIFGIFITISANLDLNFYEQMLPLIIRVAASFAAMQILDNYVLQPVIFSKSVKAHPLEIFIIILMGAKINGIMGMVLAIPVYTVLRVVAKTFLSELRVVQALTESLK